MILSNNKNNGRRVGHAVFNETANRTDFKEIRLYFLLAFKAAKEHPQDRIEQFFDVGHIRCYPARGCELDGARCFGKGIPSGTSWAVFNNDYDVYEIPSIHNNNKEHPELGEFFVLAHNLTFGGWIASVLSVSCNSTGFATDGMTASFTIAGTVCFFTDGTTGLPCMSCVSDPVGTALGVYSPKIAWDAKHTRQCVGYGIKLDDYSVVKHPQAYSKHIWKSGKTHFKPKKPKHT